MLVAPDGCRREPLHALRCRDRAGRGFGVLLQVTTLIHALPTRLQIAPDILLAACSWLHRHTVGG
jgi:hypothetical protein